MEEVMQTKREVILELDVPGFEKKDFNIEFTKNAVNIEAKKKTSSEMKNKGMVQRESRLQDFEYSRTLPNIDVEKSGWEYSSGFLRLTMPKL